MPTATNGEEKEDRDPDLIQFRLLFLDPKKRKTQHKENEAIQFGYNMEKDVPEDVVWEMVSWDQNMQFGNFLPMQV